MSFTSYFNSSVGKREKKRAVRLLNMGQEQEKGAIVDRNSSWLERL
jgi:hypothetical protein